MDKEPENERPSRSFTVDPELAEFVKAHYLDEEHLIASDYQLYRINSKGQRWYTRVDDDFEYPTVPSVTTVISESQPMGDGLLKWYCDLGYVEANEASQRAAEYGTWMHIVFGRLLLGEDFPFDNAKLEREIRDYCEAEGVDFAKIDLKSYQNKIKQDVLGFIRWVKEYQIKALAVEAPVWSEKYAGFIDMVVWATMYENGDPETQAKINKRQDIIDENDIRIKDGIKKPLKVPEESQRILIMVDLKSGRSGDWPEWAIQLRAYVLAWNEEHGDGDLQVRRWFNYHCKNYRIPIGKTVKPYAFVEQTYNKEQSKWEHYLDMFHAAGHKIENRTEFLPLEVNLESEITELYETFNPLERFTAEVTHQRLRHVFRSLSEADLDKDEVAAKLFERWGDSDVSEFIELPIELRSDVLEWAKGQEEEDDQD